MKRIIGVIFCLFLCGAMPAQADVIITGNVSPDLPATWLDPASTGINATLGADGVSTPDTLAADDSSHIYSRDTRIGEFAGNVSSVSLTGSNTIWDSSRYVYLGFGGSGTLSVTNGAQFNSVRLTANLAAGSSSTLSVSNATVTTTSHMSIGHAGVSTVDVTNGGSVTAGLLATLGGSATGNATVNVSGGSSFTSNGTYLAVANEGTAEVNISGGSTLTNNQGTICAVAGSVGTVNITESGSKWINSGECQVGAVTGTDAKLYIEDEGYVAVGGAMTINGGVYMSTGGMLSLYGDYDDSLMTFMDAIDGNDQICYLDSGDNWSLLSGATPGTDYTLTNELVGSDTYTVLTVGAVPEPGTVILILSSLVTIGFFCKKK